MKSLELEKILVTTKETDKIIIYDTFSGIYHNITDYEYQDGKLILHIEIKTL